MHLYDLVKDNEGLVAQMRVAMVSGLPTPKAAEAPDSPENVAKLKAAIKQVTGKDASA
ncbi:MAG TPA: hypothetical protein VGN26_04960 [Armatimonadota bacterium]